jgi:prepilin-type N-terminal cleavage/methylation domain-containing protein
VTGATPRRGFTLVEVLVALVILEIGVLGAMSLLALAGRTMARAERLENAVAAVEGVADSLTLAAAIADGSRSLPGGATLEWRAAPGGAFSVRLDDAAGPGPSITLLGRHAGDPSVAY